MTLNSLVDKVAVFSVHKRFIIVIRYVSKFTAASCGFPCAVLPAIARRSSSNIQSHYWYVQDSNPTPGTCRHGQQSDISRPESATPYSSLERSVVDRGSVQQPQSQQQQQQQTQRTPPAPPGVQWGRQKSTPSGDCFDPSSRRLIMFHNNRSNDDSALPMTFA